MTMAVPAQEFQMGQRVRCYGQKPFIIRMIYTTFDDYIMYGAGTGLPGFVANALTLVPDRPPYVPSEVRIVSRQGNGNSTSEYITWFRPETKAELAARHAIERAAYDAQGDRV